MTIAAVVGAFAGIACGFAYQLGRHHERVALEAVVSAAETTCCPRFRAPHQADLDALVAAGGSLSVYVDEGGACATLWHNGQPIRGYAGHPLDAARGCLEAWIVEGGGR